MQSGQHDFAEAWFFFFTPFSSCYILHCYRGNQNPTDGSDWRECMILSTSTSLHSTSKQSDCTLSQGLHPSGHQHPDNIGITLRLCDLHSCNVLSTLRSCLYCLGLNFCVYKDLTILYDTKCKYLILYGAFSISCSHRPIDIFLI